MNVMQSMKNAVMARGMDRGVKMSVFAGAVVIALVLLVLWLVALFNSGFTMPRSDLILGPVTSGANLRHATIRDDGYATAAIHVPDHAGFAGGHDFSNSFYGITGSPKSVEDSDVVQSMYGGDRFEPYKDRFEAFDAGIDRFAQHALAR